MKNKSKDSSKDVVDARKERKGKGKEKKELHFIKVEDDVRDLLRGFVRLSVKKAEVGAEYDTQRSLVYESVPKGKSAKVKLKESDKVFALTHGVRRGLGNTDAIKAHLEKTGRLETYGEQKWTFKLDDLEKAARTDKDLKKLLKDAINEADVVNISEFKEAE